MRPSLSLIIPIYKTEQYLSECIDSILKQDLSGVEIILIDDGSPDRCPKICDKYASENSKIIVIHKENGGLSSARNSGLKASNGEYVWFIDSDDYLLQTALNDVRSELINNDTFDVYSSGLMRYYEESRTFIPEKIPYGHIYNNPGEYLWDKTPAGASTRFICKRDFLISNNLYFYQGLLHEDGEWGLRMLYLAKSIKILERPIYAYRIRNSGSIMSNITIKSAYDLVKGHRSLISFMNSNVRREDQKKYRLRIWTMLQIINIFCEPLFKTKGFDNFLKYNLPYIRRQVFKIIKSNPFRIKSYFYLLHPYIQSKLLKIIRRK